MQYPHVRGRARSILAAAVSALTAITVMAAPASAATQTNPALLYDYQFANAPTSGTITNSGSADVPLQLTGTYTAKATGVLFSGNLKGKESVAYGKPASGPTIYAAPKDAVGFGAEIVYQKPAGKATCFTGTPNITQIGRFSSTPGAGQLKIQLSSCEDSATQTMFECRIGGSLSAPATPWLSTVALVSGDTYVVTCLKTPDSSTGDTITLTVTDVTTDTTTPTTFTVPAIGKIRTLLYLSAANVYALPKTSANHNQFNGLMMSTAYCLGSSLTNVSDCLSAALPTS
jgi:hypothetical protein